MKIAKNNVISNWIKENKELMLKIKNNETISAEKVFELAGVKASSKIQYVNVNGDIFALSFNDKNNVKDIYPYAETFERKAQMITEHTDTETNTYSEAGGYLINGLLFSNGYGDGYNRVIIRKFLKEPHIYTSRAEIYDKTNCQIVRTPNGVKIWKHDCVDMEDTAIINQPDAFKIVIHKRTLYIMVKGW